MNNINNYLQKFMKLKTVGLADVDKLDDKLKEQIYAITQRIEDQKDEQQQKTQNLPIGMKLKETQYERVQNNY